ncbi:SDR family NAD(P)-dependent oxidoreductase [Archangium violaceum]|uniref:SDR family NAD(P)-dependent oxidoreductase n=1 Tax=Archangium violaceum TaxID=83451 RepID=UPI00193C210D|nr:SDR family NAD(P)-dependent oxidoreductase [Archangium violaceum]QRK09299.1 SDR family NAD(P)-dependent oxidoreductase [Archangium violaceum]
MKELRDRVAVITGAASGIGLGLAERCAREGMRVVLADVEEEALRRAGAELEAAGARVLCVRTDVSRAKEVEELAKRTLSTFGAVHLVCNNAGVAAGGLAWEATSEDWDWVLGVNLWGVIHGVRTFVPLMLEQGSEGHVVNTASMAGLLPFHPSAPYQVSKYGVVALTEQLHGSLRMQGAKVGASVLCPGWVRTRILDAVRNRPGGPPPPPVEPPTPAQAAMNAFFRKEVEAGLSPAQVADQVISAVREQRLYVVTHPEMMGDVRSRMEALLAS